MTVVMVSSMLQNGFEPHEIYVVDRHATKARSGEIEEMLKLQSGKKG